MNSWTCWKSVKWVILWNSVFLKCHDSNETIMWLFDSRYLKNHTHPFLPEFRGSFMSILPDKSLSISNFWGRCAVLDVSYVYSCTHKLLWRHQFLWWNSLLFTWVPRAHGQNKTQDVNKTGNLTVVAVIHNLSTQSILIAIKTFPNSFRNTVWPELSNAYLTQMIGLQNDCQGNLWSTPKKLWIFLGSSRALENCICMALY